MSAALPVCRRMEVTNDPSAAGLSCSRHLPDSLPAVLAEATPAPMTEQAQNNRPYLLVFPVLVLGIIGALVIITRKK